MPDHRQRSNRPNAQANRKKDSNKLSKFGDHLRLPVPFRNLQGQIFRTVRRSTVATLVQSTADVLGVIYFTLDNLLGYTEFTTLFDQYRIDFAEVRFRPMYNQFTVNNPSTGALYPPILTVIDYDDANTITKAQALEFSTCREVSVAKSFSRKLVPKFAVAAYSGTFTSYAPKTGFVDCNSPSVQHYGVKYVIPAALVGQGNLTTWTVESIVYCSFLFSR